MDDEDRLPTELVIPILQEVKGRQLFTTHSDLRNCCLVSRTWCCLTQPLLFSEIPLQPHRHAAVLRDHFNEFPHLPPLVLKLDLWRGYMGRWTKESCDILAHLFNLLVNLRSLTLQHTDIMTEFIAAGHYSKLRTLQLLNVEMSLENFASIVSSSPHLQNLQLERFAITSSDGYVPHVPLNQHRLEQLKVQYPITRGRMLRRLYFDTISHSTSHCNTVLYQMLLSYMFDLTKVEDATLGWVYHKEDTEEKALFYRVLNLLAPSVTTLRLHSSLEMQQAIEGVNDSSHFNVAFDMPLPPFPSLRQLSLDVTGLERVEGGVVPQSHGALRILQKLKSPLLTHLSIAIAFYDPEKLSTFASWSAFDELLASPMSLFPSFQNLTLWTMHDVPDPAPVLESSITPREAAKLLESSFSRLKLHCRFTRWVRKQSPSYYWLGEFRDGML